MLIGLEKKIFTPEYESYYLDLRIIPKENSSSSLLTNETEISILKISLESLYLNGLIRGLETLSQIIYFNENNSRQEIYNLPINIQDQPEYAYRGVMIDTSRHFLSIKKIKKILNGMLHSKLNVLHWHMTDDEYFGFSTDIGLTNQNNQKYLYSKKSIKEIVDYACLRGITIIPEIDNPSHTRSWKDLQNTEKLVITKPEYGTLDPSKNETYILVQKLISEVSQTFSVNSKNYFHLGGDEVLSEMWSNDSIHKFMKENNITSIPELENYYFNKIRTLLPTDRNYIYWISNQAQKFYDIFDKKNSVMMYWGFLEGLKNYLDSFPNQDIERSLILTPADYVYLDCGFGNKYGDGTWCGNYKTWKTIFDIPIFKNYKNFKILGSQVVLFGELADEQSVIGKIFPRACSLAERLWSKEKINIKNFFVKLIHHNRRLNSRGIPSISFTTQLCENEPQECIDSIN
jgi:hexosaminidase